MEKAMRFRERVIDTMANPELNKRRVKPLTENIDFYTRAKTYKYGLRKLIGPERIMVGKLKPLN